MGGCANGTDCFLLAPEVVVSVAETFGAVGAFIKAEVLGDRKSFPKEEEAFQCSVCGGSLYNGEDNGGACFPTPCSGLVSQPGTW